MLFTRIEVLFRGLITLHSLNGVKKVMQLVQKASCVHAIFTYVSTKPQLCGTHFFSINWHNLWLSLMWQTQLKSWKPFLSLSYFLIRIHSTEDISHNVFDCLRRTNIKHLVHWVWLGCRAEKLMVGSLEWTYLGHNC